MIKKRVTYGLPKINRSNKINIQSELISKNPYEKYRQDLLSIGKCENLT